jgi:hypothetical protein
MGPTIKTFRIKCSSAVAAPNDDQSAETAFNRRGAHPANSPPARAPLAPDGTGDAPPYWNVSESAPPVNGSTVIKAGYSCASK